MNLFDLLEPVDAPAVKVRHDAPDTSRAAAKAVLPRTGTARHRVLAALAAEPRTDEELQRDLPMSANTERPRRVECVDAGWAEDSGTRRLTGAGCESIVWRVTDAGRRALAEVEAR